MQKNESIEYRPADCQQTGVFWIKNIFLLVILSAFAPRSNSYSKVNRHFWYNGL